METLADAGITSSGTSVSVPWSRVTAVRLVQGMRGSHKAAGRCKVCLQLSDDRNEPQVNVLGGKPTLTQHACCSSSHSPSLVELKSLPFAHFSISESSGKTGAQCLDTEMQSYLMNHKPLAPQVQGYSQEGTLLRRKKNQRVPCHLGEWGGEIFTSFLEKLQSHLKAGYFGSSMRECHQTGPCFNGTSQQ